MKICVFAYATSAVFFKEVIALSQKRGDGIEWSVIMQHAPFRDFFDDVLPQERVSYIYRGFDDRFAASTCRPQDGLFRSESNINRILATDKDGYQHESKEFQYRWAAAMIEVYREFLDRVRPEHMVFSSVETVEQSLLLNMCQDRGIAVIKNVHMRTLGYSFFSTSQYDSLPPYFGDFTERDALLARDLLDKFEAGDKNPVGFPPLERPGDRVSYFPPPLAVRILRRIWDWLRYERHQRSEGHVVQRIKVNLQRWLHMARRLRFRLFSRNLFDLTRDRGNLPEKFIVYAAQVTPEASINGLAQYFIEQERIIDLLRLNLPHGYVLVVKEHPGMMGVRPRSYYRRQRRMPGVVMASPEIPMDILMEKAALSTTVTGTIGLEAYLSGRPCMMFARNFFSHLCAFAERIDSLREVLEETIRTFRPATRDEKVREIARLYNVCYPFVIYEAPFLGETLERENIATFLVAVSDHIRRVSLVPNSAGRRG